MKLFPKSLGEYGRFAQTGVLLIALVSFVRFLMLPVFNIPYSTGTHFTSVTILLWLLVAFYAVRVFQTGGSYRDVLGVAFTLVMTATAVIIAAIVIDEFGGIDTYYTDPAHGGDLNPWMHMLGHVVFGLVGTLFMWGLGSLVYFFAARMKKKAIA
ncbi:MAG: hypothetical protein ACREOO_32500 [bacterium]